VVADPSCDQVDGHDLDFALVAAPIPPRRPFDFVDAWRPHDQLADLVGQQRRLQPGTAPERPLQDRGVRPTGRPTGYPGRARIATRPFYFPPKTAPRYYYSSDPSLSTCSTL
jgi:hypothetical protein